jgi:hypothetical protein
MDVWGIGIRFLSGADVLNFFDIEIIWGTLIFLSN